MKKIIIQMIGNFFLSLAIAVFAAIVLSLNEVDQDNVNGWSTILFNIIWIVGYFRFSKIAFLYLDMTPIIGVFSFKRLIVYLCSAICSFALILFMVNIFHGRIHIADNFGWKAGVIFLIASAAAMEEILFRGYLLKLLQQRFQPHIAIAAASFIFTVAHYPYCFQLLDFFFYFSFATCLSIIAIKFNSLLPGIIYHAISNFGVGLTRLATKGDFEHFGVFHFENGNPSSTYMVVSIVSMIIFSVSIYFLEIEKNDPTPALDIARQ